MTDYLASVELRVAISGGAEIVRQSWPVSRPDLGLYVVMPAGGILEADATPVWAELPALDPEGELEFTVRVAGGGEDPAELIADIWDDARSRGMKPREIRIQGTAVPRPVPFERPVE